MLKIDILTLFPKFFDNFFETSIIGRAKTKKIIDPKTHDLKDWGLGQYRKVDDRPYGGGPGMIMRADVTARALESILVSSRGRKAVAISRLPRPPRRFAGQARNDRNKPKIVLLTPRGKVFDQAMAKKLSKEKALLFICPHYEGYDERIASLADYKISIGNYILTGGELPAMVIIDAITRLLPGVIKPESLKEESFSKEIKNLKFKIKNYSAASRQYLEYPQYTRPEVFEVKTGSRKIKKRVPKILLSGNHALINEWRERNRA